MSLRSQLHGMVRQDCEFTVSLGCMVGTYTKERERETEIEIDRHTWGEGERKGGREAGNRSLGWAI